MGKSRRNRAKPRPGQDHLSAARKPPKPPADPELAALREERILPALQGLTSTDPKICSEATGTVANLAQDPKCRKLLLREQVVRIILSSTITDAAALEIKMIGWGILRVLTENEAADFCVHLYRLDILKAISDAAKQITDTLNSQTIPFGRISVTQQSSTWELTERLIFILSAVAEANDDAPEEIASHPNIIGFLFLLMTDGRLIPEVIHECALSCLWVLSEDNKKLAEIIAANPAESTPLTILRRSVKNEDLTAIYASGILHHVFSVLGWSEIINGPDGLSDANLVASLSAALKTFYYCEKPHQETSSMSVVRPKHAQVALEILAMIGAGLQDIWAGEQASGVNGDAKDADEKMEEEDEDEDDEDDSEVDAAAGKDDDDDFDEFDGDDDGDAEMGQDEINADIEMVTGTDEDDDKDPNLSPILAELCCGAVPELTRLATVETPYCDIRGHAISALNNIAWSVSCLDFANGQNLATAEFWQPFGRKVWDSVVLPVLLSDTADMDMATKVTTLAWAIARTMRGCLPLKNDEPKFFISLYHATRNLPADDKLAGKASSHAGDPLQSPGVKCIGVLGQLALHPCPVPINREIGVFLITLLSALPSTPPADAVEALNHLFDMYGDEEHAYEKEVFWKDNFIQHLERALPKAKTMLKSIDGRTMAEMRSRANEAVFNLERFIQYKKKNKPA